MTTTIAQMTGAVGKIGSAGYKRIRGTCVMASSSHHIQKLQDKDLDRALTRLRKVNFDMDRLSNPNVEMLYAYFDKKMSKKITDEFIFHTSIGNIQDHGACTEHCDLCGKGDSRDDGANEDKLRYTFRLTNIAGGDDIWVGSSCIFQHGLYVDGAATADEAKEILRKSLAQHMAQWKIESWQAEHPDHEDIPEQWRMFKHWSPRRLGNIEMWKALGIDVQELDRARWAVWKAFRTASKFYARKFHLPTNTNTQRGRSKTQDWEEVKRLLAINTWTAPLLREANSKARIA